MQMHHSQKRLIFRTFDTSECVALMTLGVDFADTRDPETGKVLSPINTTHSPEFPNGQTTYALAPQNNTGLNTADLHEAWDAQRADVEFDQTLAAASAALERVGQPGLASALTAQFPLALMVYFRGISENRARVLDLRSKGRVFRRFPRGATGFRLISDNASPQTRAHLGLPVR